MDWGGEVGGPNLANWGGGWGSEFGSLKMHMLEFCRCFTGSMGPNINFKVLLPWIVSLFERRVSILGTLCVK